MAVLLTELLFNCPEFPTAGVLIGPPPDIIDLSLITNLSEGITNLPARRRRTTAKAGRRHQFLRGIDKDDLFVRYDDIEIA
jgi:hypothetical protein